MRSRSPLPVALPVALLASGLLASACGEAHGDVVTECADATSAPQGARCDFGVECGVARADELRSAVCDNGRLLTARIVDVEGGAACAEALAVPATSERVALVIDDAPGCVRATVCDAEGARVARLCQVAPAEGPPAGEPWTDCVTAVREGVDGDACEGAFACVADKTLGPAGALALLGWCDDGALRLAPSQTLIFGPPR